MEEAGPPAARGILEGIKVLDFGRFVAAPYCASLLADFGAEVIRVERPGGGEDRQIMPVSDGGDGAVFLQMNRNKKSLTLDLRHPAARPVLERLVAGADVVVTNVPAQALATLGLDYESLSAIRPDIVHANVSAFGDEGPWRERGGFDSVGQAMCGSVFLSGEHGRHFRTPISWVDHATGLHAAFGVMAALFDRQKTGSGQRVEASLLGTALSFAGNYIVEEAMTSIGRAAIGNRSAINGPTDLFATSDGEIMVQVVGDPIFRRWTKLVGEPGWLDDPRFSSDAARGENGAILSSRMAAWCATRRTDEALDALSGAGIPAGPVLSPRQALDHPQVRAAGLVDAVDRAGSGGRLSLLRAPIRFGGNPASIRSAPPAPGEHNEAVLGSLGLSEAEIQALKREGAI